MDINNTVGGVAIESTKLFDEPGDCTTCLGHRWMMWRRIQNSGYTIPELRSCPDCNPDGKNPPPIYRPSNVRTQGSERSGDTLQ